MKKTRKPISSFALFLLLMVFISAGVGFFLPMITRAEKTPPDSYLKTKVYSVDALIKEIQSDPAIKLRYSRQFHVPPDKLIAYLRQNVVESYIQKTADYTVYCVRPNGYMYPAMQRFNQGTKVFALKNGQPVMKWVCGNPLMKFLPVVNTKFVMKPFPVIVEKVSPSIEQIIPAQGTQDVLPTQTAIYQPAVPVLTAPLVGGTQSILTGVGTGVGSYVPYIVGAGVVPFTVGHSTGTGTSGSSGPIPIVPEPQSDTTVVMGLVPIILAIAYASRSRRQKSV